MGARSVSEDRARGQRRPTFALHLGLLSLAIVWCSFDAAASRPGEIPPANLRHVNRPQPTFIVSSSSTPSARNTVGEHINIAPFNMVVPLALGGAPFVLLGIRDNGKTLRNLQREGTGTVSAVGQQSLHLVRDTARHAKTAQEKWSQVNGSPHTLLSSVFGGEFPPALSDALFSFAIRVH